MAQIEETVTIEGVMRREEMPDTETAEAARLQNRGRYQGRDLYHNRPAAIRFHSAESFLPCDRGIRRHSDNRN